jgi:DNA-binding NarL/FixJ family response regulator
MARCVTCGSELHPERAAKYDYCTRRECQEKNAKSLKILAVGVNKAADQYEVLEGRTRAETAARPYRDDRLASSGKGRAPVRATPPGRGGPPRKAPDRPWSEPQQRLARIYNARGLRPDEIAQELGLSTRTVIQMLLDPAPAAG